MSRNLAFPDQRLKRNFRLLTYTAHVRRLLNPKLFWVRLTIAGLVIASFESWEIARPSFWADEVATIAASHRSLPQLIHMLSTIDAVHGSYYLLIHVLGNLFGFTPFALRLPSSLAVATTAVVMALVAKKVFGERLAWFTLLITALLPRLVWAATEARSYGIDALLTATVLLLFLHILDASGRRLKWLWVGYTFLVILDAHFFIYSLLVAGSHGVWLLWQNRKLFRQWLLSMVVTVATSAFIITWVLIEKDQVGWLPPLGPTTIDEIFVGQAFWGNPNLAYLANGLILALLAGAVNPARLIAPDQRKFIVLAGGMVLVPPAIILVASLLSSPIYDSRYFTMTAPMVALLLAVALESLFTRRSSLVALLLVLALSVPTYFRFRETAAKGTHWEQVAAAIYRVEKPGDGILFTDYDRKSPSQSRIMIAYPSMVSDLTDLTQIRPYQRAEGLYPKRAKVTQVTARFKSHRRILVLHESDEKREYDQVAAVLKARGFGFEKRIRVVRSWISIFVRK